MRECVKVQCKAKATLHHLSVRGELSSVPPRNGVCQGARLDAISTRSSLVPSTEGPAASSNSFEEVAVTPGSYFKN